MQQHGSLASFRTSCLSLWRAFVQPVPAFLTLAIMPDHGKAMGIVANGIMDGSRKNGHHWADDMPL